MAAKVKAVDTFKQAMLGCIELEKTKKGLGKLFHSAFVDLLNENPGMTGEELSEVFVSTMTEVENTLRSELVEAFGEEYDLKAEMPSWTQYKSDYKQALKKVDRRDLIQCGGVADVKKKLNEVRKAMQEKEEGGASDDSGVPAGAAGTPATGTGLDKVPAGARHFLEEAINTLSRLSEEEATEVAVNFKNAAAARLRNLGKANRKVAGVNGSSNKAVA